MTLGRTCTPYSKRYPTLYNTQPVVLTTNTRTHTSMRLNLPHPQYSSRPPQLIYAEEVVEAMDGAPISVCGKGSSLIVSILFSRVAIAAVSSSYFNTGTDVRQKVTDKSRAIRLGDTYYQKSKNRVAAKERKKERKGEIPYSPDRPSCTP